MRTCIMCGCTEAKACAVPGPDGGVRGCSWYPGSTPICTACVAKACEQLGVGVRVQVKAKGFAASRKVDGRSGVVKRVPSQFREYRYVNLDECIGKSGRHLKARTSEFVPIWELEVIA